MLDEYQGAFDLHMLFARARAFVKCLQACSDAQ